MAPECFVGSITDCRRDIYALGLVFYEMLTGQPVIGRGATRAQIDRIVNEIPPPPSALNPRIASEIDDVVLMALRKDPAQRFPNATEMKRALDRIRVSTEARDNVDVREAVVHGTVEFLLRRMAHKSDFPALSASLTSINQISALGDTTSIQQLSDRVVRDFALTQKLLRLVNSASMGMSKVTKVSEAITILGIKQLRALATSLLLASPAGGKTSPGIAMALTDSFVAGLISRNVGRIAGLAGVEELFICGMFSSLGELLSLYYLLEEYSEIERRIFHGGLQADSASRAVLGISFEELGIAVARHWRFPPEIVNALSPLPPGIVPAARDSGERMWQCAVYARELGALARINDTEARKAALEAHIARFAASIRLDGATVRELMTRSIAAAGNYITAAGLSISRTPMLQGMSDLCGESTAVAHTTPRDVADNTATQPAAYEKTIVLPKAQQSGWRARIMRALRSMG